MRNQKGFTAIQYLLVFFFVFAFVMLLPDLMLWGGTWYSAQVVINDTSQFMGEHGGGTSETISYLQERFEKAGLDPAEWDLTITQGPILKGGQGVVAVSSTYQFFSLNFIGLHVEMPIGASSTFTSQLWVR
ncbi:hypothetical protein LOK74_02010 [Brevibacillus humidisoli]|uniref:hypothetical protein n=1 Tax=Brevibacillus humidisoli TaxID=2895522 RepID=UPI001E2F7B98|nr:hypothetical protein [Brevibacillus humidisoli]UFJ41335.1 hypothetical protein LOK74_02010 [Brevibacillus humidisoli]